jgi:ADP-ribose pyrophosphatase YjhB (NUDIX family)
VLLVKEKGGSWSLPGGGMDHGETEEEALRREMYEEVLITAPFRSTIIGINPRYVEAKQAWLLWVVYELNIEQPFNYGTGEDADEVEFIDPTTFKDSTIVSERLVYKWCVDRTTEINL